MPWDASYMNMLLKYNQIYNLLLPVLFIYSFITKILLKHYAPCINEKQEL